MVMFGLPIVAAALSLMGAPASMPVDCNPAILTQYHAAGITWFRGTSGNVYPAQIEFAPYVCAGLLYLSASPSEQARLRQLNPGTNFVWDEGVSLLVVLHESHHASNDQDETNTECAAMTQLEAFVTRWVPTFDQPLALMYARNFDAALPNNIYHVHPCV